MSTPSGMRGAFTAIVRKELQANVRWIALGFVISVVVVALDLTNFHDDINHTVAQEYLLGALGAPIAGFLLALAQVLPENRGDRFAYLLHRPVSRTTIFFGKVVAGLLMYAVVVVIPLACWYAWLAMPGHVAAPFDVRMLLPGVASVCCGVAFYLAGFFCAMRDARWYASRWLGFGAAVTCSGMVFIAADFGQAMLWWALCTAVLATAAWGTFIARGGYSSQPGVARAATAITVAPGLAIAGMWVLIVIFGVVRAFYAAPSPPPLRSVDFRLTRYGDVVRIVTDSSEPRRIFELDGSESERFQGALRDHMSDSIEVATLNFDHDRIPGVVSSRLDDGIYNSPRIYRPLGCLECRGDELLWFYWDRHGLVGYSTKTRRAVAWVGRDGFTTQEPAVAWTSNRFTAVASVWLSESNFAPGGVLLAFPDRVYSIDFANRVVDTVFVAPVGDTIVDATATNSSPATQFIAVATMKEVYVLQPYRNAVLHFPRDTTGHYSLLQVSRARAAPEVRFVLWYMPAGFLEWYKDTSSAPQVVARFTAAGVAVDRREVRPRLERRVAQADLAKGIFAGIEIPPVVYMLQEIGLSAPLLFGERALRSPTEQQLTTVIVILLALNGAIAAFMLARSQALAQTSVISWTLACAALGPLGLLMMLCVVEWSPRETCPRCRRKRVVTREQCEHCSAPFAPPALDGTEIFA